MAEAYVPLVTRGGVGGRGSRASGGGSGRRGGDPMGRGARAEAQPAGGAVLERKDDGDEPGLGVDLGAHLDAVPGTRLDAAPTALAVLRQENGVGLFHGRGHACAPFLALKGCKLLATAPRRGRAGFWLSRRGSAEG